MIELSDIEAEVIVEVLLDFPQNIKWTIKKVNLEELRKKIIKKLEAQHANTATR